MARRSARKAAGPRRPGPQTARQLSDGLACHRAGDLAAAAAAYQRVLAADPDNGDALHLLGVVYQQAGKPAEAVPLLRRAAGAAPKNAEIRSNLGVALHATGDAAGAADAFRAATALNPAYVEAHANLAGLLVRLGDLDGAIAAFEAAHRLSPATPRFLKRLGELCLERNHLAAACDWFGKYLALEPGDADGQNNMAFACERIKRFSDAEGYYRKALALKPRSPEIASNLGSVLKQLGRHDEARGFIDQALAASPDAWEKPSNRAGALCNAGDVEGALVLYEALCLQSPGDAALLTEYARALELAGRPTAAVDVFLRAVAADPRATDARLELGICLMRTKRPADAADIFRRLVEMEPHHLGAHLQLCLALLELHRLDEACDTARRITGLADYRASLFVVPHTAFRRTCSFDDAEGLKVSHAALCDDAEGARLLAGGFLDSLVVADGPEQIEPLVALHRRCGDDMMTGAATNPLPARAGTPREGKLRLGFLSSDLYKHSVGRFVKPLMENYDRDRFDIYCYTPHEAANDSVQQRIRDRVKAFRIVDDLSHRDLAATIRDDGIDILLELNGFTGESRMRAMAYRPAPVQIYWLGYPFTTGLLAMDYILVDADYAPERDDWLVEKPLIIPGSWVCYDPFEVVPLPDAPPVARNGFVTFGTLNNVYKFSRPMVALWAEAMNAVPNSRFLLVRPECASALLRGNLTAEFARHGVAADRLEFVNNKEFARPHFSYYDRIDLSLDTYPLTGGTTTADALWMGVPVVTLVGPSLHQRISYAILRKAGLDDLCARSPEDFLARAVTLAQDTDRLCALRTGLRPRLLDSPFCRGDLFARHFCDLMQRLAERHGLR